MERGKGSAKTTERLRPRGIGRRTILPTTNASRASPLLEPKSSARHWWHFGPWCMMVAWHDDRFHWPRRRSPGDRTRSLRGAAQRDFRLFLSGNFLWVLGFKMQTVAVGYEIYQRTGNPLALGMVGLVQIVPVLGLALIAGHVADRFDRRAIILVSLACTVAASLGLALVSLGGSEVWAIYLLVAITGVARGFSQPARASFLPQIVLRDRFPNAITWSTGAFQLAFVLGPALGGLLIAAFAGGTSAVYVCHAAAALVFFALLVMIRPRGVAPTSEGLTLASLAAGARFVWSQKVMLGALSLDLFAVLLGGATALLPIYASATILGVGPRGLGWMEAAPALGAVAMTIVMAHRPPMERAGPAMLWSVAGFGAATIVFGVSRWFPLSLVMLLLTGRSTTSASSSVTRSCNCSRRTQCAGGSRL